MRIIVEASCLILVSRRCKRACTSANNISRPAKDDFGFQYSLDGVPYPTVDMTDIPVGYTSVDVHLDDEGEEFQCKMVAGHVAAAASVSSVLARSSFPASSSLQRYLEVVGQNLYDTLSPAPQWFLYIKAEKPRWGREEEDAKAVLELMKRWGGLDDPDST